LSTGANFTNILGEAITSVDSNMQKRH
jgi:hypothetical protein